MDEAKVLEQMPVEMSVDDDDEMPTSTKARTQPQLSINTNDSEGKISSSERKKTFSPSEKIVKALSPAIGAAKTVIPKVEPISFKNFCGLSFKVALP